MNHCEWIWRKSWNHLSPIFLFFQISKLRPRKVIMTTHQPYMKSANSQQVHNFYFYHIHITSIYLSSSMIFRASNGLRYLSFIINRKLWYYITLPKTKSGQRETGEQVPVKRKIYFKKWSQRFVRLLQALHSSQLLILSFFPILSHTDTCFMKKLCFLLLHQF